MTSWTSSAAGSTSPAHLLHLRPPAAQGTVLVLQQLKVQMVSENPCESVAHIHLIVAHLHCNFAAAPPSMALSYHAPSIQQLMY